jgi:hypothetical protein
MHNLTESELKEVLRKKIPVIMCIDVEPDERVVHRYDRVPWKGLELSYEFFSRLRSLLASATGSPVHYSWFFRMDPQVAETYGSAAWPVLHYSRYVEDFARNGDEIGLHTHAWRWDEPRKSWLADHGDPAWVEQCIRVSFESFHEALGRGCASFRFGDRWMSNATMELIESLGARFDLTLEPGHGATPFHTGDELYTGSIPDYTEVPQFPYRPSRADFRKPDPSRPHGLWTIPISSGYVVKREAPLRRLYRMVFPGVHEQLLPLTLGMWHDPRDFHAVMDRILMKGQVPYLAFVVRSDLPLRTMMPHMQEIFEGILAHPWVDRFVFSTPAEAMAQLEY